jgi:hypothetical protein
VRGGSLKFSGQRQSVRLHAAQRSEIADAFLDQEQALREQLGRLRARYATTGMPDNVCPLARFLEIELAWLLHQRGQS